MKSIKDVLGEIIYGRHYDADEMRNHNQLFLARMQGVSAANLRWSLWLQKQGYTQAEATYIISSDMDPE